MGVGVEEISWLRLTAALGSPCWKAVAASCGVGHPRFRWLRLPPSRVAPQPSAVLAIACTASVLPSSRSSTTRCASR